MQFGVATTFLVLLTIGFFVFHKFDKDSQTPLFVDTIAPAQVTQEMIAHNEFLLLMDEGDEQYVSQVLREFGLTVITPLEEWVHVARQEATHSERIVALSSAAGQESLRFIETLEAHPAVHSAHLNYVQTVDAMISGNNDQAKPITPQDPYFKYQWHLQKNGGIDIPQAWSITTGNPNTVIAVVDRNFDMREADWSLNQCSSRQFYYENILEYFKHNSRPQTPSTEHHGSNVLSVLAPCTDNALGLSGIDWRAQIFSVDSRSDASLSTRLLGLLWAAGIDVCSSAIASCPDKKIQNNRHPANIINASFGFAGSYLQDPPYALVLDVIGRINRRGQIIVASAGNEGGQADRRLPGSAGGVISVGSSNKKRQSSRFSNFGKTIDVLAPGEHIVGLSQGQTIDLNGTSFSSPITAGVVSLMRSVQPALSWKSAEYILKHTALPLSCEDYCPSSMDTNSRSECQSYCCQGDRSICAAGIINAHHAVRMAKQGVPQTALVDVDDYYLPLSLDNKLTTKLIVKNWGKKTGLVRMKTTDPHLSMTPKEIEIASIDNQGVPGQKMVLIQYDHMPKKPTVVSLVLEIANTDTPHTYHDQIEAIVEMVPDPAPSR